MKVDVLDIINRKIVTPIFNKLNAQPSAQEVTTTRKRGYGNGSVYSYSTKTGVTWVADYRRSGKRVRQRFQTEAEAHAFLDNMNNEITPEQPDLFSDIEQQPVSAKQEKVPARSWIYDSINKTYIHVNKATVLGKGCSVIQVTPFSPEALPMLVGRIIQNPPYRRMVIVASAYNKVYFGGVTAPQDPAKILEEGWTFVDTGAPFGSF